MRPHPRGADTDPRRPRAWATCERCGFVYNHYKLSWQFDWRGQRPMNLKVLVCDPCLDSMQRQLGTLILPPDPLPIMNARPEQYLLDENPVSTRITMSGRIRVVNRGPNPPRAARIVSTPGNLALS